MAGTTFPGDKTGVSIKPSRNQPCPCGSGAKYKFCCIGDERVSRLVPTSDRARQAGAPDALDLTHDVANVISGMNRALHHFCKDNGVFLSSSILTVGQNLNLTAELRAGALTKAKLLEAYRDGATQTVVAGLLTDACDHFPAFASRREILMEVVEAHYRGLYCLSVPVMLAQIEGILRDIGSLAPRDSVKPTIKRDWENRTLFGLSESAVMFNAFLHRLYEGQQGIGVLNRNPVLHGTDTSYGTVDNSVLLLLALLEIRMFLWFEKNTKPLF